MTCLGARSESHYSAAPLLRRWLDEGENDGKVVRELDPLPATGPTLDQLRHNLLVCSLANLNFHPRTVSQFDNSSCVVDSSFLNLYSCPPPDSSYVLFIHWLAISSAPGFVQWLHSDKVME